MHTKLWAVTTILLVGLAAPTFAQDDPHHPAESDVQAVESSANAGAAKPADCLAPAAGHMDMMAMMNGGNGSGMAGPMQMMATMQMMMQMQMQMMQMQMHQMQMKMAPDPASSEGGSP